MVVGDDVAVLTDDESGPGGDALVLLPALLDHHLGIDIHTGIHIGGVNLFQTHLLQTVRLLDIHLSGGGVVLIDGGGTGRPTEQSVESRRAAHACAAAHQGATQHQGHHLTRPLMAFLGFALRRFRPGIRV